MSRDRYDVAIIGAGLGGLSTGIRLQRAGLRVLLLERLDRVGGLCGTVREGGRHFVIACNDFGSGLLRDLDDLGVSFPFERTRSRIRFESRDYYLPPDLRTLLRLLPRGREILRHVRGLGRARRREFEGAEFLSKHLAELGIVGSTADLLMLPAYLMGVSPDRFRLDALDHEFRHQYGYAKPLTPIGGPQAFADTLANRFQALGGHLRLRTEVQWPMQGSLQGSMQAWTQNALPASVGEAVKAQGLRLQTNQGEIEADRIVSTLPQPGHYRAGFEQGLPISMLWLRLDPAFALPAGIHTHVHYPAGIANWFGALYAGVLPPQFGFHLFASDLGIQAGSRTANLYFYLPRDSEEDESVQARAIHYIQGQLDGLLPGLAEAIQDYRLVSPGQFQRRHGIAPRVTPVIAPAGYPDAVNYRPDLKTYFAGAASYPPGDHAGAAIRSSDHLTRILMEHNGRSHAP